MSAFRIAVSPAVERIALGSAVGLLAAAAWAALWMSGVHAHGHGPRIDTLDAAGALSVTPMLVFVAGWIVMSVAMMLPTSLPVLTALHTLARSRNDRGLLVALAVLGYLAAWTVFGAAVGPISVGLRTAVGFMHAPAWLDRMAAPALLLLAGLFQFSALKYRCLDKCRSPFTFVLSHWRGTHQRWQAFRLGWASGVFCVGCCWALMLLMLVSGVGHLAWMLALGLIMAAEKNVRWGRRLSAPLGAVLIVGAGILSLAGGSPGAVLDTAVEFCGGP